MRTKHNTVFMGVLGVYTVHKDNMHKMQLAKLTKSKINFTGKVARKRQREVWTTTQRQRDGISRGC